MARALLTPISLSDTGVVIDAQYVTITAEGVKFSNLSGKKVLHIKAATAAQITIRTYQTVNGLAVADRTISISAGKIAVIGPFSTSLYNDSDGEVWVDSNQLDTDILVFNISTNS